MLSNSCRYGIRAVIYLASQPVSNGKTGIRKISNDLDGYGHNEYEEKSGEVLESLPELEI